MSIRPVSSVSFRNNSINFESRHRRDHGEHSRHTNALRSIPVAALIAMSPMTETYAQVSPVDHAEYVQNGVPYISDEYSSVATFSNSHDIDWKTCSILWPKNSNNPKDKVLFVVETVRTRARLNGSDELVPVILEKESIIKPQKLIVVNEEYKRLNGTTEQNTVYYVQGYRNTTNGYYEIIKEKSGTTQGKLLQTKDYVVPNSELKISKQFYNQLKLIYGDSVEYTTESRQAKESESLFP